MPYKFNGLYVAWSSLVCSKLTAHSKQQQNSPQQRDWLTLRWLLMPSSRFPPKKQTCFASQPWLLASWINSRAWPYKSFVKSFRLCVIRFSFAMKNQGVRWVLVLWISTARTMGASSKALSSASGGWLVWKDPQRRFLGDMSTNSINHFMSIIFN